MNMQIVILILFIAYFTNGVEASEWVGIYENKQHPGKCVIHPSLIIERGISIKDPRHPCRQIHCGSNGTTTFQSCGIISGLPPGCRFAEYIHIDQPYPICCERTIICD